jgi:hypothetical protein
LKRDLLLAVKGFDIAETVLTCYGGAGLDDDLRQAARASRQILLADLTTL